MKPRYVVVAIRGYESGDRVARTSAWVADSAYGYKVVAIWRERANYHAITCIQRANYRAAELNAEDAAWMRDNGYAASATA